MRSTLERRRLEEELAFPGCAIALAFAARPLDTARLTPGERRILAGLTLAERRTEWLRGRAALERVLWRIGADPDTARLRFPERACSLSHCGPLAVAVAVAGPVVGVGVDLELGRELRPQAARFFLSEHERRGGDHLRLWTVKEALFKADPANAGRTLRDYELLDPAALRGRAHTRDGARQLYATSRLGRGFLSIAITRRNPC